MGIHKTSYKTKNEAEKSKKSVKTNKTNKNEVEKHGYTIQNPLISLIEHVSICFQLSPQAKFFSLKGKDIPLPNLEGPGIKPRHDFCLDPGPTYSTYTLH